MELKWTRRALSDLARWYEFLAPVNKPAAARAAQALIKAPRIGEQLFQFEPREVRRILVGEYEVRYKIRIRFSTCCGYGIPERAAEMALPPTYDFVRKSRPLDAFYMS